MEIPRQLVLLCVVNIQHPFKVSLKLTVDNNKTDIETGWYELMHITLYS